MLDAAEKTSLFQRPPGPDVIRDDPFGYLAYDHSAQRALADLLESLADSLPDCVNRAAAALAASMLRTAYPRHCAAEDAALFPVLERVCAEEVTLKAMRQAAREHEDTAGQAIELAEALDALAASGRPENPESLGFMLRGFFDGLRRHLDWCEAAILPRARRLFEGRDEAELGRRLVELVQGESLRQAAGLAVIEGARRQAV